MAATTLFIICALLSAMMATLCIRTALKSDKDLFHGYLGIFFVSALPAPLLAYATSLIRVGSGAAVPVLLGFDVLFLALAALASPIRSTSNLSTYLLAFLVQQVLAIDVTLVEYPGQFVTLSRLASGASDVSLEIWPNDKENVIRELVIQRQLIAMYGALGYVGRISWYFPSYIADLYPSIIFSSWGSMRDPNLLQLLPRAGTTPPQRRPDGSYLCSSWYCQNGEYVPPQCQGAAYTTCREFWHVMPDYSPGMDEQRILDFNLPLVVVYLGSAFIPTVTACIERQSSNSTCLFFYWAPETLPSRYSLQAVHFPPATFACMTAFNQSISPSNTTSWRCDWETDVLQKFATASIKQRVSPVHSLLLNFIVRDTDIAAMLSALSDPTDTAATACAWLRANEHIWGPWISLPPSDYVKVLQPISAKISPFAITLALFALLVVVNLLSLIGLARFRDDPLVRLQSPVLVAAINFGTLTSGVGSVLELMLANALTSVVCVAKMTVSTLGLGIVLAALLAKTWRVFYIFSNLRLSLVIAGRLFRLNVTTKHLALLSALILGLDALLISLWISVVLPRPVQKFTGRTEFTYRCGSLMDQGPATTAQITFMALPMLYHWMLAGVGLFLAHRIRSLAMVNNESTVTMFAMASVTLSTLLVAANQVTVTDPFVLVFANAIVALLSLLVTSVVMSLRPLILAVDSGGRLLFGSRARAAQVRGRRVSTKSPDAGNSRRSGDAIGAITKLVNESLEDVGLDTRDEPSSKAGNHAFLAAVAGASDEKMAVAVQAVATAWNGTGKIARESIACRLPVLVCSHMGRRDADAWWWTPWQTVTLVLIPTLQTLLILDRDPWSTHTQNLVLRRVADARAVFSAPPLPGQRGSLSDQSRFLLIADPTSLKSHTSVIQCRDAAEVRRPVWFRSDPLIRIQSPALVAAFNLGALVSGIGTTLDLVFANAASALVCTAKTAVSALGLGTVLVALLAKTWHTSRYSGALILTLDALLILVWISATLPQPVQQSASATKFTYRCGSLMDLGTVTTVQVALTGLALLYHWVLSGTCLYLA
ncbi:hypothetical protein GGF31_006303 [Allomyces arbusculus]|nr:hypothetical protein GGF31_006303 [Allomyces arbusculus]